MRYDRIVISGCERFSVSGRYYIEIFPSSKVQMILGTNGSGKTTLAQLGFSPLPIDVKHMRKGGYFIKEGTYKGDRYKLEGKYNGRTSNFTFIKNDEVLLKDGNQTTYLDLVNIHLEYNRWLHELLTGRILFTNLGPQQRQDLLSKISKSDFSKAFNMLKEYRKQFNHYTSITKFLKKRISEEELKLLKEDDYTKLRKEKEILSIDYQELSSIELEPLNPDAIDYNTARFEAESKINQILKRWNTGPDKPNLTELDSYYNRLQAELISKKDLREEINEIITNHQQELGSISGDLDDIKSKMDEVSRLENELSKLPNLDSNIPKEYFEKSIDGNIESLLVLLDDLPHSLPDLNIILTDEKDLMEENLKLQRYRDILARIEDELKLIGEIELVTCPKCTNTFKPGIDNERITKLNDQAGKGLNLIRDVEKIIIDKTEALNVKKQDRFKLDKLEQFREESKSITPGLFTYIDSLGGFKLGKELISKLSIFKNTNHLYFKRLEIEENLTRLKTILSHVQELDTKHKELTKDISTNNNLLIDLNKVIMDLEDKSKKVDDYKRWLSVEERNFRELIEKVKNLEASIKGQVNKELRDIKSEMMADVLSRMANIDKQLSEQEIILTLINDFKSQLEEAELQVDVYKAIVDEMSPKSGIIAEQIILSIGGILKGLNQLFDKIWGYPLTVSMGTVGDNGLDYKFPMTDSTITRDDVADGSDSMLEMVNRAMVLMAYYSMDLNDLPLFLDEPGRTFDKTHKLNLIPLIRDLSDSTRYSQIVLISHSEDIQTSLPNSEVIIMDDRNIQYPHPYNEHVSFEEPGIV